MTAPVTPWNGVPVNPEVRQLHVLRLGTETVIGDWRPEEQDETGGWMGLRGYSPGLVAQVGYQYVSPVRTDADLAAAWVMGRDDAKAIAEERDAGGPVWADGLDIGDLISELTPPPDLGAALAQILEAWAAYLMERLTALCEILESDGEVVGCVGSDAPAEHEVGLARAVIRARTPTTGGQADG